MQNHASFSMIEKKRWPQRSFMWDFVVNTVPADELATFGASASGARLTKT